MILSLPRCFRRYSATSMPSLVMRSTVIVEATDSPVFLSVLPAPLWSHCTMVNISPGSKEQERPRIRYITWTAVQKQQHGIAAVLAADRDPLFDSTDTDVAAFVGAICEGHWII